MKYSGIGILEKDGIRHSVFGMNGISSVPRFTRNTQNTRAFGKFLAGNPTRPPALVVWLEWLPVGRRSSSQVTSARMDERSFGN